MVFRYRHGDRPLDGYTIQRGVGAGGFGEVYYAVSDGGRQVALKVLQQNPEIELRGVGHCMNLKSPFLVTIFDVKRSAEGLPFVIMEYVTGPSLRDLLNESPAGLGADTSAFFVREIARGLAYLHDCGIVHRDLKPENIFVENGCVKIGDYGLSKYISHSRQSQQTISVGTVHYMAPEIGSGRYHRGIDIYALGIILYEMLSGRVPFTGDSFGEILMKHLTQEPDLAGFSHPFDEVIRKALRKNPDERYGKVEEMSEELLRSAGVQEMLKGFRPETISRSPKKPEEPVHETVVLGPPPLKSPTPNGAAPAAMAESPPPRAGIGTPVEDFPAQPGFRAHQESFIRSLGLGGQEGRQKRILALLTATAMSVVVGLMGQQGSIGAALGSFLLIASGSLAVLFCHREVPGRFTFEPGMPRRLLTVCIASPLYLFFTQLYFGFSSRGSHDLRNSVLALIACTALINWEPRTRKTRKQRIDLGDAFKAGLVGFIAAMIAQQDWILIAGVPAAISLVVNVLAPYESRSGRKAAPAQVSAPAEPAAEFAPAAASIPLAQDQPAAAPEVFTAEPKPPPLPPSAGGPIPMGVWGRVIWFGFSGALLSLAITMFVLTLAAFRGDDEKLAGTITAIASIGYFIPSFRLGCSRYWPRAWSLLRGFLLTGLIVTTVSTGAAMLFIPPRGDEFIIAITVLIFSLVFALFLGLMPKRFSKARLQAANGRMDSAAGSSPGWSALGSLLVTVGFSVTLGSALLASGIGDQILRNMSSQAEATVKDFTASRLHLLLGCVFFVPGLFCILRGRQGHGAAHVFRGALGLSGAGTLVFILSKLIPERIITDPGGQIQFAQVGFSDLEWLFGLGVLTALLLFWPAKMAGPRGELKSEVTYER